MWSPIQNYFRGEAANDSNEFLRDDPQKTALDFDRKH